MKEPTTSEQHRWSWRIGNVAGIAVYIHATFLLLLAWIAMSHLSAGHDAVADAMVAEFQTLPPQLPLGDAARILARRFQHDFPVVEAGRVVGMLTRADIERGLATHASDTAVADVMHRQFAVANASEELASVLGRLPADGSSLLVVDHDRAIGLLDSQHVGGMLAMREARGA